MIEKQISILCIFHAFSLFGSLELQRKSELKDYNKIFIAMDNHNFDTAANKIEQLPGSNGKKFANECFTTIYHKSLSGQYKELENGIKELGFINKNDLNIYETFLEFSEEISNMHALNPYEYHIKRVCLPHIKGALEKIIDFLRKKK